MIIYLLLLCSYILLAIIENFILKKFYKRNPMIKRLWMLLLVLPLWAMVAFRAPDVGSDTSSYMYLFDKYSKQDLFSSFESTSLEFGFVMICRVFGLLNISYIGFQIAIATVTFFAFSKFIYRYSENYAISWIVFITQLSFARTMNISREMLAVAISLMAITYILQKKYIRYSFLTLITISIHKSGILLILLLLFNKIKWNKRKIILSIIMSVAVVFLFDYIFISIIEIIGDYQYLLSSVYIQSQGVVAQLINVLFGLIFLIISFFSNLINIDRLVRNNEIRDKIVLEAIIFDYLVLALVISLAGVHFGLADRLAMYFSMIYMIVLPNSIKLLKYKFNRFIISLTLVSGLTIYFTIVMIFRNEWHRVVPYHFY